MFYKITSILSRFSEIVNKPFLWEDKQKNIKKELISINSKKDYEKPTEIAICTIQLTYNSNIDSKSSYLISNPDSYTLSNVQIGFANNPIDIYIEYIITQMLLGEKSRCTIETKSGFVIDFICELLEIAENPIYFELTSLQMYNYALKFKECGVHLFKNHPLFAQNYFSKAAKCLISLSIIQTLENKQEIDVLLRTIYINLAACFLKQNRNEDVLYVLKSDDQLLMRQEKAIYRKAHAYYNLKRYEEARTTLSLCDYKKISEMIALWNKIRNDEKSSNKQYSSIVKKMFT